MIHSEPRQRWANAVVDDFDARSADELTLRKTERVELVELDEGFGDGWYLGRHLGREATGLFPGGKLEALHCLDKIPEELFADGCSSLYCQVAS